MQKQSPIFAKSYDFLKWLLPVLGGFPKEQRFRLARKIEESAFLFQDRIIAATHFPQAETRHIEDAVYELKKLKIYTRLAMDIGYLKFNQYEHSLTCLEELNRLINGWKKKAETAR